MHRTEDRIVLILTQPLHQIVPARRDLLKFDPTIPGNFNEEILCVAVHINSLGAKIDRIPIGIDPHAQNASRTPSATASGEKKNEKNQKPIHNRPSYMNGYL